MYHLDTHRLRVCGRYTREGANREAFSKSRFIIIQHLLTDTEELVGLLHQTGADVFCVLAKPYSIDQYVLKRMEENGHNIVCFSYSDNDDLLDGVLSSAIEKSKSDNRQIVILDVGGYFAKPLTKLNQEDATQIAGLVEDTTFGHRRYEEMVARIPIPVFSVARSALKEIEAKFVGNAAILAIDSVFRELGVSLAGRNALVIGYGMIGKNVANALQSQNVRVSVYDKKDHRNLKAYCRGFVVDRKIELLKHADIIFSATGERAVTLADIEICRDNVVLASVGSQDIEFDIKGLRELAVRSEKIGPYITKFVLPNSKNVMVVNDGVAVNLIIQSVPSEVMDLVFAELITCSALLLRHPGQYIPGQIYQTPEISLNLIAKDWLKFVNC
jgi:adenosylhomocysteinase